MASNAPGSFELSVHASGDDHGTPAAVGGDSVAVDLELHPERHCDTYREASVTTINARRVIYLPSEFIAMALA